MAVFRGRDLGRAVPLMRESVWVLIGQAGVLVGGLVGIRLITGVVPPAVYGDAALLLGVVALASSVFCAPFLQGAIRFYSRARDAGSVAPFRAVVESLLGRAVGIAVALLLAGGAVWVWLGDSGVGFGTFLLAGALLCLNVLRLMEAGLLNAARRRRHHGLWNAFDAWARPAAVIGFVLWLGPTVPVLMLGYVVGALVSNLAFRRNLIRGDLEASRSLDPDWSDSLRRDLMRFAIPLAPIAVLMWISSLSDRYVLAALAGSDAAGLYVAAYGLSSRPFLAFAGIANITFLPLLYDAVARGDVRRERQVVLSWLGLLAAGMLAGVALVIVLQNEIVRLALGERYWGAASLMPWIAGAYAFWGGQQLFECLIYAHSRTRLLSVSHGIAAVSSLTLYAVLIPRMGAPGAAIGTFCALGITCCVTFFLSGAPALIAGHRGGGAPSGGSVPEVGPAPE